MSYKTDSELIAQYELYTLAFAERMQRGEVFDTIASGIRFPVHINNAETLNVEGINPSFEQSMGRGMEELQELGFSHMQEVTHPISLAALPSFVQKMVDNAEQARAAPFIQHVKRVGAKDYEPIITFSTPVMLDNPVMFCLSPNSKRLTESMDRLSRLIEVDSFKIKNFQKFNALSSRERAIMTELACGLNNRVIGEKFAISRATVETHRKSIKRKLEISSFSDLMRFSLAFGLLKLDHH